MSMWARVHKIDRVRPLPNGGAIILVEDDRNAAAMGRIPGLSTTIAIARILNARRLLDVKYAGKGEVRYATSASLPSFLFDAVARAGAAIADRSGDKVLLPAAPAGIASTIDTAFSELAHHARTMSNSADMLTALRRGEEARRKAPLDRDVNPTAYWTAVFELAALAGELSRPRGGRWIETHDAPVPFAIKFPDNAGGELLARPAKLAMRIVEGEDVEASLASEALTTESSSI
ncbi:MAG: hypothetical protein NT062_09795 [Proteobacteria bacterium]|nr:hypothetical protein [Pseudomonadota bacterium]